MTITEVAKRAGVSISTVSNVLNKKKYVSEELTRRVHVAVQELGYRANPIAQNMKLKHTNTVGIITADLCGLFYPYVLKGMYEQFYAQGYKVMIMDSDASNNRLGSIDKLIDGVKNLIFNQVDGIVFACTIPESVQESFVKEIKHIANYKKKIGLVCIESDLSKYGIDSVFANSKEGARIATSHLIDVGCDKIGHISGPEYIAVSRDRIIGYKEVMAQNGLPVDERTMIAHGDYTHKTGYLAMKELLRKMPGINGVFVANDQMSIGALKALKEAKKHVPDDIKVVGYDDVFVASVLEPSLTTINVKKKRMGMIAADLLIQQINREEETDKVAAIEIESKLVIRRTTVKDVAEDWILLDW